ncbi:hypothetical protein [Streptosporangium canum]|uniref:hypothetical protein n=1 Tax=Streptosporangium canum TaxID=324952 RepID=UPI00378C410A
MTKDSARKKDVRARQAATGEAYSAAARALRHDGQTSGTLADFDDRLRLQPLSLSLPYQVRTLRQAQWTSAGWCTSAERAVELADAVLAWHGGAERAHVWDYSATLEAARRGDQREVPAVLLHQATAATDRPAQPEPPAKTPGRYRPEGVGPQVATEPAWLEPADGLLQARYALHTWTAAERGAGSWSTAAWCFDRYSAQAAAAALGVGHCEGRYPWGAITGPAGDWASPGRDRRTVALLPERAPGEPLMGCLHTGELDDPYEDGVYGWLTCTLERGHVETHHQLAVTTEE